MARSFHASRAEVHERDAIADSFTEIGRRVARVQLMIEVPVYSPRAL